MRATAALAACLAGLLNAAPSWADDEAPVPLPPAEESPGPTWGTEVDVNSRYLWRGMAFSRRAVVQPTAWIAHRGFLLGGWSSLNAAPLGERRLAETDLWVTWSGEPRGVSLEVTLLGYLWRSSVTFVNAELEAKASVPAGPLRLFTLQIYDLSRYRHSWHALTGASWQRPLGSSSLEVKAGLGWASRTFNHFYVGVEAATPFEASLDVAVTRKLRGRFYVRPHLTVSGFLDNRIRAALPDATLITPGIAFGF